MSLLTPAGKSGFNWTNLGNKFEKEGLTKTASTGSKPGSREDLYKIAEDVLKKAQLLENEETSFGDPAPEVAPTDSPEVTPVSEEGLSSLEKAPEVSPAEVSESKPSGGDAVSAVQDLVKKVENAEKITEKVQEALEKVETAVGEVKDAVGVVAEEAPKSEDDSEPSEEVEEIEIEISDELDEKEEDKEDDSEKLIKESEEKDEDSKKDCGTKCAKVDVDNFVKISKIGNETRKEIQSYWEKLGLPKDFVALMVKNYEK